MITGTLQMSDHMFFSTQLQSFIKTDFCSTRDYHEEGCSTAVMFNLGHQIHLMIGVCIWKRFLPTVLFVLFTQEVNAEADQSVQIVNYFILDIHIFDFHGSLNGGNHLVHIFKLYVQLNIPTVKE